jgi:SAM-dependent methyltransferase
MTNAVLNSLIARVNAEASAHEHRVDRNEGSATEDYVQFPAMDTQTRAPGSPGGAGIGCLLVGDSNDFVDTAYRLLLGRGADPAGKANYGTQLTRGASRLGIAAKIRLSGEGRRVGAPATGLWMPMALVVADKLLRRIGLGALTARALRYLEARDTRLAEPLSQRRAVERIFAAWHRPLERIAGMVPRHDRELAELSKRVRDLQQAIAPVPTVTPDVIDAYYLAFEDANRGSQESVLTKLSIYDNWLASHVPVRPGLSHTIVDIGCGRGEWLSYSAKKNFDVVGIDMNRVMVDLCLERGFDARCTDALSFLRSLPTGSVAAVTGFHIIEHLPFDYLFALVAESYRVLAEGGSVLFETPNPENLLVGSHTFYHDFTHRNPITPTAISFLLKHQGFGDIDIIRSSPYPDEAKVPGNDPLTERVNGHLCGPQDFAVTGRKSRAEGARA